VSEAAEGRCAFGAAKGAALAHQYCIICTLLGAHRRCVQN
jgi:hypothetical protein